MANDAIRVCSSSDFPDPVVPATRTCGPSAARSTANGPSALTPRHADVDQGCASHPATMTSARGSRSNSSSDAVVGNELPPSNGVASQWCQRPCQALGPSQRDAIGENVRHVWRRANAQVHRRVDSTGEHRRAPALAREVSLCY